MQPSLRKALTNNCIHKAGALIIGIGFWGVISPLHEDVKTVTVPLCFYSSQPIVEGTSTLPIGTPETVQVTLKGKRSELRTIDWQNLAAHIDTERIDSSGKISLSNEELFLPKSVKVVNYKPLNLSIHKS